MVACYPMLIHGTCKILLLHYFRMQQWVQPLYHHLPTILISCNQVHVSFFLHGRILSFVSCYASYLLEILQIEIKRPVYKAFKLVNQSYCLWLAGVLSSHRQAVSIGNVGRFGAQCPCPCMRVNTSCGEFSKLRDYLLLFIVIVRICSFS